MAWIVKLVSIGAEGEEHSTDVMRIAKPDTLADLGTLGLSLAESKQLLAGIQREIVAAQARLHAMRRPACPGIVQRLGGYAASANDGCGWEGAGSKRWPKPGPSAPL